MRERLFFPFRGGTNINSIDTNHTHGKRLRENRRSIKRRRVHSKCRAQIHEQARQIAGGIHRNAKDIRGHNTHVYQKRYGRKWCGR